MEHRHHARTAVDLCLLIYRRGIPVATGRVRDASAVGLYVHTEYPELREHQRLEVEFRLGAEAEAARHRVAAHVLRCAPGGVALEIDDGEARAAPAMRSLLGHAAPGGTVRAGPGAPAA